MHEPAALLPAVLAGIALGAIHFGGLWWTVRRMASVRRPAPWLLGSLLLRSSILLAGLYAAGAGHWPRLLACLLGVLISRTILTRLARPPLLAPAGGAGAADEVRRAP